MRKCLIGLKELAFVLVAFVAGLNLVSLNVAGQQITGSIRGTVLDPSGAVVQAATVTAKHIETGLTRAAVADRQGAYVLAELPIGHYQVEVHARGFCAGLESEYPTLFRRGLALSDRTRGHHRSETAALHRKESARIYPRRRRQRQSSIQRKQCKSTAALFRMHAGESK